MDSRVGATIGIGLVTAVLAGFAAYGDIRAGGGSTEYEAGGTVAMHDTASDTHDSAALVKPRWLSDGNLLALVGVMNAREVAATNVELQRWHSDSVRALAAATAHEHAVMQHAADSLAAVTRIAPVPPAIASVIDTTLGAQVDSLAAYRGAALDRAFVQQQAASHTLMASYLDAMTGLAERPEVRDLLASLSGQAAQQAARAQSLAVIINKVDSTAAADSAAAHTAKRNRPRTIQ